VQGVDYRVHIKRGADEDAPKTMRVDYHGSLTERYSEWVCPEHTGWARRKFEAWWRERSHTPPPDSAAEAVERALEGMLAEPTEITVRTGGEFPRITQYILGEKPDPATRGLAATEAFLSDECSLEDIPF
jgi:DNA repair protein RadD